MGQSLEYKEFTIKVGEIDMEEFSIIPEKDVKKRPPKKYKISPAAETVYNIETGKNHKVVPINATAYDLPIYAYPTKMVKSSQYRDAIIIDIRRKLKKVKENIKNCNFNSLNDLCKIFYKKSILGKRISRD